MLDEKYGELCRKISIMPLLKFIPNWLPVNFITLFGLVCGLAVLPLLLYKKAILAIAALLLSGYFDTLDGVLARAREESTPWGCVLDIFCDRLVEISVIVGLYLYASEARALSSLLLLASIMLCVTSFLLAGILSENASNKAFYYSSGLIERAEAFIFFILMILLPEYFNFLALVLTGLILITAFIRLYELYSKVLVQPS